MVSRTQQGSGSFTWFLLVVLSLVLVARVQPFPGYGPSGRRYQAQQQALADTTPTDDYLDDHLDYSQLYDYNPLLRMREPEFYHYDEVRLTRV